jgi:hypothetical protein
MIIYLGAAARTSSQQMTPSQVAIRRTITEHVFVMFFSASFLDTRMYSVHTIGFFIPDFPIYLSGQGYERIRASFAVQNKQPFYK